MEKLKLSTYFVILTPKNSKWLSSIKISLNLNYNSFCQANFKTETVHLIFVRIYSFTSYFTTYFLALSVRIAIATPVVIIEFF